MQGKSYYESEVVLEPLTFIGYIQNFVLGIFVSVHWEWIKKTFKLYVGTCKCELLHAFLIPITVTGVLLFNMMSELLWVCLTSLFYIPF